MNTNPKIFEINTRVFLRRFDTADKRATLGSVPPEFWKSLASAGIDIVWLMGVWKICPETIGRCCFQEGLMKSYDRALRNWRHDDIIGSPYAIDAYELSSEIGTDEELAALRAALASLGMKLMLDFIPNHFSSASRYLESHPEIFLQCPKEMFEQDVHTYFRCPFNSEQYFAHGRDPFYPAWTDTAQLNYFNPATRGFMIENLRKIADMCDGVRCDMAMLVLENVFNNTWAGSIKAAGFSKPAVPFWQEAIAETLAQNPGFIFVAETYWDLEWEMQQLGFHFTYDKRLYDRLKSGSVNSITGHLHADREYQERLVRFIENHDEERAVTAFGRERSLAAAVIMSTVQGMKLFHDGQFEGKRIKLPVQLGREPQETLSPQVQDSYARLLQILKNSVFKTGVWELLDTAAAAENNHRYENMLAWRWKNAESMLLIIVNYSSDQAQCRIQIPAADLSPEFTLTDLWTGKEYNRTKQEVSGDGLYVDLPPWGFHIFSL